MISLVIKPEDYFEEEDLEEYDSLGAK